MTAAWIAEAEALHRDCADGECVVTRLIADNRRLEQSCESIEAYAARTLGLIAAERDALAARLAAVEALADQWEAYTRGVLIDLGGGATWHARHAKALRAALSAAPTDTTKEN